jgi:glycosyltransferase involved in cell wall biosynthesis
LDLFHSHDWTFIPAIRADFGIIAARSLSCGAPVIVHDIPPFSGMIRNRREGILIPCEVTMNRLGAPTAVFNPFAVVEILGQIMDRDGLVEELRSRDWELEKRKKVFDNCWGFTAS